MKDKIKYREVRRINTGNYEHVELEYGIETIAKEGENTKKASKRIMDIVKQRLDKEESRIREDIDD